MSALACGACASFISFDAYDTVDYPAPDAARPIGVDAANDRGDGSPSDASPLAGPLLTDSGFPLKDGFESAGDAGCGPSWQGETATLALDSKHHGGGAFSCRVCPVTTGLQAFFFLPATALANPGPGLYRLSACVSTPLNGPPVNGYFDIDTTTPDGGVVGNALIAFNATDAWTCLSTSASIPAGQLSLTYKLLSYVATDCFLVDDVEFTLPP
jgi:hypothetical protein